MRTPALLAILDGVGLSECSVGNALAQANAPFLKRLFSNEAYPCCSLGASGRDVGLPVGQMGNSEVGHLNIGAGRVVEQELSRINSAIDDGSFFTNVALAHAFDSARLAKTTVHIMGLLGTGGIHATDEHLEALLAMAARAGNKRIRVHVFLDGRDTPPMSARAFAKRLDDFCAGLVMQHMGLDLRIGTMCGRYYAMDRDKRWERIERAWRAMVVPFEPDVRVVFSNEDPHTLIQQSYTKGITDEFVEPIALGDDAIIDGDSVIFFNFRPDRARELTQAFIDPDFDGYGFERPSLPRVNFVCMTEYDPRFASDFGARVAFPKTTVPNTLADYFATLGLRQLHIAETEKYAHVTFFFNGGEEAVKAGEERILIPSPHVATYDLKPQMSAEELTAELVHAIATDTADVYIVNYANGDMVGHTGVLKAAIQAIEAVDAGLEAVVDALLAKGGVGLVTADHGNSEKMLDEDNNPWTAHTTHRVPLVLIDPMAATTGLHLATADDARLADVAPTLLDLMELPVPQEFTGRSLLARRA